MNIEVLGAGCKSCDKVYENVLSAIENIEQGNTIKVKKVKDVNYFVKKGIFMTPGLMINDEVVSTGRVLSVEEIQDKIKEYM